MTRTYPCLAHPRRATAGEAPAAAGCKNTYLLPGLRIRSALRRWARAPAPGAPPLRAPLPPPRGPAAPSAPPPTPFERARARLRTGGSPGPAPALSLPAPARVPEAAEGPCGCLGNGDPHGPRAGNHPRRGAWGHHGAGDRVASESPGRRLAPAVPPHHPGCVFTRCAASGGAQCPPRFLPAFPGVCIAPKEPLKDLPTSQCPRSSHPHVTDTVVCWSRFVEEFCPGSTCPDRECFE